MTFTDARRRKGWTQAEAARRLGLTQGYVSLLERGLRLASPGVVARARKLFGPDFQAPSGDGEPAAVLVPADELARRLGALGYEPFLYLAGRADSSPLDLLLAGLSHSDLEARLVEALPWLALRLTDADWVRLVERAKQLDLQNRLGYVASLSREVAARHGDDQAADRLFAAEKMLERSVLFREDTLCRDSMTAAERRWLEQNRPDGARRWRLVTDLRAEDLPYAA